ncbi:MAG: hypothetical protein L0227_11030 [Chloroflexi bacterium]|nr:hypothetical protein [Chloroflexota bacterium]
MSERLIDERPYSRRVYVRTPGVISGGLTVWHIREFAKALDQAGIPDSAMIDSRKANDTLHLVELSAHRDDHLEADR